MVRIVCTYHVYEARNGAVLVVVVKEEVTRTMTTRVQVWEFWLICNGSAKSETFNNILFL